MNASQTLKEPDFEIKARAHSVSKKRKPVLGVTIGVSTPVLAFILSLVAWNFNERHPRTDDAVARANLIGIAPRVSGPIVKVHVQDNQFVKSGDLLFEIDPADFKTAVRPSVGLQSGSKPSTEAAGSRSGNRIVRKEG